LLRLVQEETTQNDANATAAKHNGSPVQAQLRCSLLCCDTVLMGHHHPSAHASHGCIASTLLLMLWKVVGLNGLTEDSCLQYRQDDAQASLASRESSPDESLIAEGWIVAGTIMSNRDYRSGKQPSDS